MDTEKTLGIRVPLIQAEKIRKYLIEKDLLRKDLKLKKEETFLYLPVKDSPIIKEFRNLQVITKEFEKHKAKLNPCKTIISIPEQLKTELPTSYDIVGDIILVKLSKKLEMFKKEVGNWLLKYNKHIKTVCSIRPVAGEMRTRNIEVIAGEKRSKTIHKEYALEFVIDIKKAYFSPRLASERKRISELVKPGEIIVDMFAGVAPFSIMIAKFANPKIIIAIDNNKHAVEYAKLNIKINNVLDKIEVINIDAKNVHKILHNRGYKADRVIMNLPFSAFSFFPVALKIIADTCIIHYYDILEDKKIEDRIKDLKEIAKKKRIILTNLELRRIKTYSPREFYIGVDITAKKEMPM